MRGNKKAYDDLPETKLLLLIVKDDQHAFQELYHRYSGRLYSSILRMTKSVELADDILQTVFIKIWENRVNIDTDRSFKSYIYQITKNTIFDWFRKNAKEQSLLSTITLLREEAEISESPVEKWLCEKENRAILKIAVDQLPPRRREIYQLCKLEGHTYDQVSEIFGISNSTVNDHIVKASKTLKEYLILSRYYTAILFFFFL